MLISVNLSKQVYEYFKGYDLSQVTDKLLDMYDFTSLPPITGERYKEVRINVTNELYLDLYERYGARSKKVSLSRLLEFAYTMDVLALPRFQVMRDQELENPVPDLLEKAYRILCEARKYDDSPELNDITKLVRAYFTFYKENVTVGLEE